MLAKIGVALMLLAMVVVALVLIDKEHFKGLVGSAFLPVITSGVLLGSILVIVGALMLPERNTWRGIFLVVWGLIAITSPLFGFLFLFPWGVLLVLLPIVISILITFSRTRPA